MTRGVDRPSARVVVIDEEDRVLLFRIEDALDDKPPVWITPGGGVDANETTAVAAARELREETGLTVDPAALSTPVAVCRGTWVHRGTPLHSEDWYFALRTRHFDPDDAGWTDLERELHAAWRWWTCDELETTHEIVLPAGLAAIVRGVVRGRLPEVPQELPWTTI